MTAKKTTDADSPETFDELTANLTQGQFTDAHFKKTGQRFLTESEIKKAAGKLIEDNKESE